MNKSKSMAVAAAALAMCMAGSAFAQDRHFERGDDRYQRQERRWQQRGDERLHVNQDYRRGQHYDQYQDARASRPEWRRGGYVPRDYARPNYVVTDWRARQLQAPPQGYQWVGAGSEFALAAIATGLIAQIIVNH